MSIKRCTGVRSSTVLFVLAISTLVTVSAVAQQAPLRVVQSSDGTLYVVQGASSWTLVPDEISDSDITALNMSGELDGVVGPQSPPVRIVQASDGSLYIINGQNAWTFVPDQISDADVAALNPTGKIDGTLPDELLSGPPQTPSAVVSVPTPAAPAPTAPTTSSAAPGICGVVPAGMVGCWSGNGTARDLVGGNDGELIGGAGFAPGVGGQAFSFNGKGQYVRIPPSPKLDSSGQVSIVFWMRADKSNPLSGNCQGLVTSPGYLVELSPCGPLVINFGMTSIGQGSHSMSDTAGGYVFKQEQWHHVAGVYDGVALRQYVDGANTGLVPFSGRPAPFGKTDFWAVGSEDGRGSACGFCVGNRYFTGLIGDVRIYNRALTATEVGQIYTSKS